MSIQDWFTPPVGSWRDETGYARDFRDRPGVEPDSLHSSIWVQLPASVAVGSTLTLSADPVGNTSGRVRLQGGVFATSVETTKVRQPVQLQVTAESGYEEAVTLTVLDDGVAIQVDAVDLDWVVTTRAEETTNDEFPYELPFTLG